MLFSAEQKGFFVEYSPDTVFIAMTSSMESPILVEDVRECPAGDAKALEEAIAQLQPKKSPSGFLHATCGIYPSKRLVRWITSECGFCVSPPTDDVALHCFDCDHAEVLETMGHETGK